MQLKLAIKVASLAVVAAASDSLERCSASSLTCAEELDDAGLLQLGAAKNRRPKHNLKSNKLGSFAEASKRVKRRRGNTSSLTANEVGSYFSEAYGSGYMWSIGQVVSDVLDFGGATGQVKFGTFTAEDVSVGNIWPTGGQSLTDGILGLAPGCLDKGCDGQYSDVVSGLVDAGALTSHVVTMCLDDSPDAKEITGTLGLGPSDIALPEDAQIIPAKLGKQVYTLEATGTVTISFSGQFLDGYTKEVWDKTGSIVDSGTGGLDMPFEILRAVYIWFKEKLADTDTECQNLWNAYYEMESEGPSPNITKEMVECSVSAVPDITVSFGPNMNLTVEGSTFFYPLEPCGGSYGVAWQEGKGGQWIFGTAFLYGKVVQFNAADQDNVHIAVLGPSNGCQVDYSEGQNHSVPISGGVPGQLLSKNSGIVTAEISLGTPLQTGFKVQLDTGSSDLLVYKKGCLMYGTTECEDHTQCESCMVPVPVGDSNVWYIQAYSRGQLRGNFTETCLDYLNDFFEKSGCKMGSDVYGQYCGPVTLEQINEGLPKYVRPYAKCAATRDICGTAKYFDTETSSTFSPQGANSTFEPATPPPPFTAKVNCDAATCSGK